ncbi:hypothetical protein [Puia sp.]|jgi:hypothetical protein|uniref:hypothetical protein n=1 Tax=Puia sp. TaxID=2045100 RepID=UPI002F3F0EB7
MDQSKDELLERNKNQMYDGKTRTGEDISPSYLEDPYFKSPEAAQRYSDWKDDITPNSNRKPGVPNLYINGAFYRSLRIEVSGEVIITDSSFPEAADIERKFTTKIFGLGGRYKADFLSDFLKPVFREHIMAATGLNFPL